MTNYTEQLIAKSKDVSKDVEWWKILANQIRLSADAQLNERMLESVRSGELGRHSVPVNTVLMNPALENIDPWDESKLTSELKEMIIEECKINPWYFMKTCLEYRTIEGHWVPRN